MIFLFGIALEFSDRVNGMVESKAAYSVGFGYVELPKLRRIITLPSLMNCRHAMSSLG